MAEVTLQDAAQAAIADAPRNKGGRPKGARNKARSVSQKGRMV